MRVKDQNMKLLIPLQSDRAAAPVVFSLAIVLCACAWASAQTERKIISDDFTGNRKEVTSTNRASTASAAARARSRRTYRLATKPIARPRTNPNGDDDAKLGITIWRLRPVTTGDSGSTAGGNGTRILTREKGTTTEWVPERVEADTNFRDGDRVRLSIESASNGYLYVVDRELFADGSTGDAMLIYPWAGADNQVQPGRLVDIPAQEDDPSFFTARPSSARQVGEVLTIIITSSRLDLPISDKPLQLSSSQVAQWEKTWGGQTERFEMDGGAGQAWTKEEQLASAKRGTRQLTREDPPPQTIYRVATTDKKALLVNVRLRYGK